MTTPADEVRTAAQALRTARFAGAMTATPAVAALLRAREPLATLLETVLSSAHEASPAHEHCASWCTPDTCDLAAAVAVARAITGRPATPASNQGADGDPLCVCMHPRSRHPKISGRLLCDECDPDSTDNLVCAEFERLTPPWCTPAPAPATTASAPAATGRRSSSAANDSPATRTRSPAGPPAP